jgi:hypothetical protein
MDYFEDGPAMVFVVCCAGTLRHVLITVATDVFKQDK